MSRTENWGVSQNNGFGSPPSFLWDIDALGDHRLLFVATLDHYLVVFYRQGEGHVGVGASLGELGKVLALDAGVFEGVLVVGKVLVGVGAHAIGFDEGDGVEVVVLGLVAILHLPVEFHVDGHGKLRHAHGDGIEDVVVETAGQNHGRGVEQILLVLQHLVQFAIEGVVERGGDGRSLARRERKGEVGPLEDVLVEGKEIGERARGDRLLGRVVVVVIAAGGEQAAEGGHGKGHDQGKE